MITDENKQINTRTSYMLALLLPVLQQTRQGVKLVDIEMLVDDGGRFDAVVLTFSDGETTYIRRPGYGVRLIEKICKALRG